MNYPKGIDISYAQVGVDYPTLCANIDFVIMKCGEKDFRDNQFLTHYNGCSAQGVTMGVYFYGRAQTDQEAVAEAQLCASLIRGKNFQLPVFYDVEGEPGMYGILYPGPKLGYTVNSIVRSFLDELRNQGITSYGVYAGWTVFNQLLNQADFDDIYIWYANYTNLSSPPQVWGRDPDIWQYTSQARYPGYSGNLDGDYLITQSFPMRDNRYYYCHPLGKRATDAWLGTYSGHGIAIDISLSTSSGGKLDTVGTPIYSICDGTVLSAEYNCGSTEKTTNPAGGNQIRIKASGTAAQTENVLDRELQFLYCHLVNPNESQYSHFPKLSPGDTVRKGQIIGGLGASGNTDDAITGGPFAHLHIQTDARIKQGTKTYDKYSGKSMHFDEGGTYPVDDVYLYALFCDGPVLTWMDIEGESGGGTVPEAEGSTHAAVIWNWFRNAGIPGVSDNPELIAGIIGNCQAESYQAIDVLGCNNGYYGPWCESNSGFRTFMGGAGFSFHPYTANPPDSSNAIPAAFEWLTQHSDSWVNWLMNVKDQVTSQHGEAGARAYAELFCVCVERCVNGTDAVIDPGVQQIMRDYYGGTTYIYQGLATRRNNAASIYNQFMT